MAVITSVDSGSPAQKRGLAPGDSIISINGNLIRDVLDYKFYSYDSLLELELEKGGRRRKVKVEKAEGQELGLGFETYLIDEAKSCTNKCVFCFIDQLPPGMRETMYFKDDDARLSFLQGNYITMTNLSDEEIKRIIKLRISPVNISIHTTNPELRREMLGNRFAGEGLETMKRFAEGGIVMNAQIVACPGLNNGPELEKTIKDLAGLYPRLNSVSVVPVGLTKYREGLYELEGYDRKRALELIKLVDAYGDAFLKELGSRIFYCADEFYLKAGLEIPPESYYEDFDQLENGVGMLRLFIEEFTEALEHLEKPRRPIDFSIATGFAAAPYIECLVDLLTLKCDNITCTVHAVKNDFFGDTIDVAGLICGRDMINQLRGRPLGEKLFIPDTMLKRNEDIFLDDVRVSDVERELGLSVRPIKTMGASLIDELNSWR